MSHEYYSESRKDEMQAGMSRFRIGFEIEKEDGTVSARDSETKKHGWKTKNDCTLRGPSYEITSPILPLSNLEKVRQSLLTQKKLIEAKASDRAGGHIHVSDLLRTPRQILADIKGYEPLLIVMYYKRLWGYTRPCPFDEIPGNRCHISLNHLGTLEVRIFPTPDSVEQCMFRARLLKHMLKTPRKNAGNVIRDMLKKNSSLYKLLREVYSEKHLLDKVEQIRKIMNHNRKVDRTIPHEIFGSDFIRKRKQQV